jgi:cell division protein FtsL
MTEYYTVKRIDNSRLARPAAPTELREFWRRVAVGAAIAACLIFYVWQHFECIQLRYQIEQLDSQRNQAVQLNEQLHLEIATLRAPSRVDAIARNRLGLTVSVPGQVTPVSATNDTVLAQASPSSQTLQP